MRKDWVLGTDGYPENPAADPNCDICKGHGVVDAGYATGCILEDCECISSNRQN